MNRIWLKVRQVKVSLGPDVAILFIFISNNGEKKSLKSQKKSFPLPPPTNTHFLRKLSPSCKTSPKKKKKKPQLPTYNWFTFPFNL
jgi:hypothetical protein